MAATYPSKQGITVILQIIAKEFKSFDPVFIIFTMSYIIKNIYGQFAYLIGLKFNMAAKKAVNVVKY